MTQTLVDEGSTVALFGFGITGRAVTAALLERKASVLLFDDSPNKEMSEIAQAMGVDLNVPISEQGLQELVKDVDFAVPTPGLPENHFFFECMKEKRIPILTEFDLSAQWDQRPILAITGTNGKTTVCTMVHQMLKKSGTASALAGNTETPLVSAIGNDETETIVVEASSFRLALSQQFKPQVAAWLNFSPDHLDVHRDLKAYEEAKKVIWKNLGPKDTAIACIEDEVVRRNIPPAATTLTFGFLKGDSRIDNGVLVVNDTRLLEVDELSRTSPHDILNSLAAASIASEGGASNAAIREVLSSFSGLPHRMTYLGSKEGVGWHNDSKSTTPHSVASAVQGFENVILIVGGRNKGVDLSPLGDLKKHLKLVIAIGEASEEIGRVFADISPVNIAHSMEEAVYLAQSHSREGDSVVLSPGCASFDWYRSYSERGDDFTKLVNEIVLGEI